MCNTACYRYVLLCLLMRDPLVLETVAVGVLCDNDGTNVRDFCLGFFIGGSNFLLAPSEAY